MSRDYNEVPCDGSEWGYITGWRDAGNRDDCPDMWVGPDSDDDDARFYWCVEEQ